MHILYKTDNTFIKKSHIIPYAFTGIVEFPGRSKQWYVNGKLHRLDGPAWDQLDGTKQWYVNGKLHRLDGPAIEWCDGDKEWHVDGIITTKEGCELYIDLLKLVKVNIKQ